MVDAKRRKELDRIIQQIPGYNPLDQAEGFTFDYEKAQRVLDFFMDPDVGMVRHVKGRLAGELYELGEWEQGVLANLFGWVDDDGLRRYREGLIYVPRKNSKAMALNTPIPTPSGWKQMEDIQVGDHVYDETGKLVLQVLDTVNRETDTTTAIITHNVAIAAMGDRVMHMSSGEITEISENEQRAPLEEITW